MQSIPAVDLLVQPILQQQKEENIAGTAYQIPLIELLNGEDQQERDVEASSRAKAPSSIKIHAYVNRVLKPLSAKLTNITSDLSSHSFRRGGAQHANSCPDLSPQWIFDRGSWNMTATNKALAYVFNTTSEDQRVSKVLSGWEVNAKPQIATTSIFDSSTRERVQTFAKELFKSSTCISDPKMCLNDHVVDVLAGSVIRHFPEFEERFPSSPYVCRVHDVLDGAGIAKSEFLSWSVALQQHATEPTKRLLDGNDDARVVQAERLINHQNCVIAELIRANQDLMNRLHRVEKHISGATAEVSEAITETPPPNDSPLTAFSTQGRRNPPKTPLQIWFEWYTKTPRLWEECSSRQALSTSKQIVSYMTLFLPQGNPAASTYHDDVLKTGKTAEANMFAFLVAQGAKKYNGSMLLKQLRQMHKNKKIENLIEDMKKRIMLGLIKDPAPGHTKDSCI